MILSVTLRPSVQFLFFQLSLIRPWSLQPVFSQEDTGESELRILIFSVTPRPPVQFLFFQLSLFAHSSFDKDFFTLVTLCFPVQILSASGVFSQSVQWALHAGGAEHTDVGVDHGGFQVGVAQQFLDGADVDA